MGLRGLLERGYGQVEDRMAVFLGAPRPVSSWRSDVRAFLAAYSAGGVYVVTTPHGHQIMGQPLAWCVMGDGPDGVVVQTVFSELSGCRVSGASEDSVRWGMRCARCARPALIKDLVLIGPHQVPSCHDCAPYVSREAEDHG